MTPFHKVGVGRSPGAFGACHPAAREPVTDSELTRGQMGPSIRVDEGRDELERKEGQHD